MIKLEHFEKQIQQAKERNLQPKYFILLQINSDVIDDYGSVSLKLKEIKLEEFDKFELVREKHSGIVPIVKEI